MRYVDEFRDAALGRAVAGEILSLVEPGRHYKVMEVCGGHTHAIYRYGIEDLLPANIELVHGPGCPVCVMPMGRVDDGIAIAREPGRDPHLLRRHDARAGIQRQPAASQGARRRHAHGLLAARTRCGSQEQNPERQVVFFAIGFETTAPSTALTLMRAKAEGLRNFSVFCNHVTIVPALRAILDSPDMRIDGFIGPGHVSTVIGCRPYRIHPRRTKANRSWSRASSLSIFCRRS